jgi:predicted TIM-barrel fold metal-dependent hydrolase
MGEYNMGRPAASDRIRIGGGMTDADQLIDCCVHHAWSSPADLVDYLSDGWREYVAANVAPDWSEFLRGVGQRPSTSLQYAPMTPVVAYLRPGHDKLPEAAPIGDRVTGSNLERLRVEHLDRHGIERAIVCPSFGMLVPALKQPRLATEVSRAANDWMIDTCLGGVDDRLYGVIIAPSQVPEAAAAEIRRVGGHPRMIGVVMATTPLGKPLGHPVYGPIYEAAAELGLVILLHAGGAGMPETLVAAGPAAGPPATYADYYALLPQVLMSHVTSLIGQGTIERYTGLQVLVVGAGAAWLVPFLWRFDTNYHGMRIEAPWLRTRPSARFRDSFRVATYPVDPAPTPEQLISYYEAFRGLEDVMCYASGYPNWDAALPPHVEAVLRPEWRRKVMRTNALNFFPWNSSIATTSGVVATQG